MRLTEADMKSLREGVIEARVRLDARTRESRGPAIPLVCVRPTPPVPTTLAVNVWSGMLRGRAYECGSTLYYIAHPGGTGPTRRSAILFAAPTLLPLVNM